MSAGWKDAVLPGSASGELPGEYERQGEVLGRAEFMRADAHELWSGSKFVARAKTANTTSAVEARIRRRHLERIADEHGLNRGKPVLDLGCADGTFAHDLLDLGFEQLVSTDILHSSVATLDRSLDGAKRERVLLLVDDLLRLPLQESSFGTVIAWGIFSVSGDFESALELSWSWLAPGGFLLLGEPLLEQALVYPLVRGDLAEFRRVLAERTRGAMWEKRDERYPVSPRSFYTGRVEKLPGAEIVEAGGVGMLSSLILGGLAQDIQIPERELSEISESLADPGNDDLDLWRQAFWLIRKA